MILQNKEIEVLANRGISIEKFREELDMLTHGFPYLKIAAPATEGRGITVPDEDMIQRSIGIWDKFIENGASVEKMVPASGAASRMFKDLYTFIEGKKDKPDNEVMKNFFENIESFAFFPMMNFLSVQLYGKSIATLIGENRFKDVANLLVSRDGLNYGKLPKALLKFHRYKGGSRTPLEEHLVESIMYAKSKGKDARVHFTVSKEHLPLFKAKIEEVKGVLEHEYGVKFDISLSVQKSSTDTIATNPDGTLYRPGGTIFFRPGGHGALIENLNEQDADVIFIKNIDNVVPDEYKDITVKYKKVLGGILVATKNMIDRYCNILKNGTPDKDKLDEMKVFLHTVLWITGDKLHEMSPEDQCKFLFEKFNRPVRVCGMVKNEGEPGGGPFLVYSADETIQPQILESNQLNPKDEKKLLKETTHFNPVDLVCSIKDYKGEKFDLTKFVDKNTGFISNKSNGPDKINALELPGLWNGAMSDWNTIFVEVPVETFNPVKTVNDLLRKMHL